MHSSLITGSRRGLPAFQYGSNERKPSKQACPLESGWRQTTTYEAGRQQALENRYAELPECVVKHLRGWPTASETRGKKLQRAEADGVLKDTIDPSCLKGKTLADGRQDEQGGRWTHKLAGLL